MTVKDALEEIGLPASDYNARLMDKAAIALMRQSTRHLDEAAVDEIIRFAVGHNKEWMLRVAQHGVPSWSQP